MAKYRITGPDGGTYEITAPDGASQEDILSYAKKQFGQKKSQQQSIFDGPNRFMRRFNDLLTFGLNDEFQAGLKTLSGRGSYSDNLAAERSKLQQAKANSSLADVIPDTAGLVVSGLATLPVAVGKAGAQLAARGMSPSAQSAITRTAEALAQPTKRQVLGEATRMGTAFGAAGAYGQAEGSGASQLKTTAAGALGGGLLGRAVPSAVYGTQERIITPLRRAASSLQASRAATPAMTRMQFEEAGVPVFGPALVDEGTIPMTARNLTGSMFGRPLRQGAAKTTDAIENRLQESLVQAGGGQPINEAGLAAQQFLRHQLTGRSIPHDAIARMGARGSRRSMDELSRIAQLDEAGLPIPPQVQPVPPRDVRQVQPRRVDMNEVRPIYPPPRKADVPPVTLEDVPVRQNLARQRETIEQDIASTATIRSELSARLPNEEQSVLAQFQALGFTSDEVAQRYAATALPPGFVPRPQPMGSNASAYPEGRGPDAMFNAFRMRVPSDRAEELKRAVARLEQVERGKQQLNMLQERQMTLQKTLSELDESIQTAKQQDLARESQQRLRDAQRVAQEATDADRRSAERAAVQAAAARERERADQLTQQLRTRAQDDAARSTEMLQRRSDDAFKQQIDRGDYSRTFGGTSETYPTEFDAGYQLANRRFFPRSGTNNRVNLLGQHKTVEGGQYAGTDTATKSVLNDILKEWQQNRLLRGDDTIESQAFVDQLRRHIGPTAVQSLYNSSRGGGITLNGLRQIRTLVREASDAEPGFRKASDVVGKRLEAALTKDYFTKLESGLDQGVAATIARVNDQRYAVFSQQLKSPLRKIFGEDVTPEQGLRRLASATQRNTADLNLLKAFYRVYSDKGSLQEASAAVLTPFMSDGVESFAKAFQNLSPEAKRLIYNGQNAELLAKHARLVSLWKKMEPYRKPAARGSGIDASNPANMILAGVALTSNIPLAIAGALGSNSLAKLMVSPRFVEWLTKTPSLAQKAKSRIGLLRHTNKLNALISSQLGLSEEAGAAAAEAIISQAIAAD